MILRDLIKTAVQGLKKEFLTEKNVAEVVEYILSNSSVHLTKKHITLQSNNLLGVGEDNKNAELPFIPAFMLFSWNDLNYKEPEGGNSRCWSLCCYSTFKSLEDALKFETGIDKELVVLLDGKVQPYKVTGLDDGRCMHGEVVWIDLEPYCLNYQNKKDGYNEENYSSLEQVKTRILDLVLDTDNTDIIVTSTLDEHGGDDMDLANLGFCVQKDVYMQGPEGKPKEQKVHFTWYNPVCYPIGR